MDINIDMNQASLESQAQANWREKVMGMHWHSSVTNSLDSHLHWVRCFSESLGSTRGDGRAYEQKSSDPPASTSFIPYFWCLTDLDYIFLMIAEQGFELQIQGPLIGILYRLLHGYVTGFGEWVSMATCMWGPHGHMNLSFSLISCRGSPWVHGLVTRIPGRLLY